MFLKKVKDNTLSYYIQDYLDRYIRRERGLSERTYEAYNTAFQQLIKFLYQRLRNRNAKVSMDNFTAENIFAFLDDLENKGISVSTRNQRLYAIKSFCRYVRIKSPNRLYNIDQILDIEKKKARLPVIQYLSAHQLEMLLEMPNRSNKQGFHDLVLISVLADTGARVSELVSMLVCDVRLDKPAQIKVHGKGGKDRYVNISENTVKMLKILFKEENLRSPVNLNRNLFLNRCHEPLTRAGVAYILQKYTTKLHTKCPASFPKKLTPHCLRHTKAMLMLEAGQNLIYIRDTLGHSSIKTTEIYARVNSKQKQNALDAVNSKIKSTDITTVDYKNDKTARDWLINYCS